MKILDTLVAGKTFALGPARHYFRLVAPLWERIVVPVVERLDLIGKSKNDVLGHKVFKHQMRPHQKTANPFFGCFLSSFFIDMSPFLQGPFVW